MNELAGCKYDVPQIQREMFDEIYAVDGNSTDGTVEFLRSENITVHTQPKKGYNEACRFAFEMCKTEALILFHPKGSVPVQDTLKFRNYFDQGFGLVIASRMINGASNEEDDKLIKPRKWFVLSLALISSLLFRRDQQMIWDVLHGFRGLTVDAFKEINPSESGVSFDLETVSRSYKKRIQRMEFPTIECERLAGTTHFKALPTGWKLLKYLVREVSRGN
jgi:glycosyltransferase involved in cell wall biosynthesis